MKKVFKLIITIVVVLVVLVAGYWAILQTGWLGKTEKQLTIDQTANVVTEIKKISEFTSACFYEEIVLKDAKASETVKGKAVNTVVGLFQKDKSKAVAKDELIIVANGKVRAGFNLSKLTDEDVVINDSVLTVNLPKAEIFDVIVNPSDFDIYIEEGKWSHEQVVVVENKAKAKIEADAKKEDILKKATESGVKKLTELFRSFGYKDVVVHIKENVAPAK